MMHLIERITPFLSDLFLTETIDQQDGHDVYEIETVSDKVVLRGSSMSAKSRAYYRFLTEYCSMDLSACGNLEVYASDNIRKPSEKIRVVIPADKRVSLTYEFYMNDAFSWDFDRWSWELDYLSMQGVNMVPMLVGNEAVWYYAALTLGINREDAMEFLSGPRYYPLQLSGRMDTVFPMTDTNYLKAQISLGQQILERMRELEIEPILPTFNGHVPKYFKGYFSGSDLFFVTPYGTYPFTYRVMPDTEMFSKVAKALSEKQKEYFGEAKYYLADPFLDVNPRGQSADLLPKYGKCILNTVKSQFPDAVWVSHACAHTNALLSDTDKESVLVLDTDGKASEMDGFSGKPFISGHRFNIGGHSSTFGNVKAVCDNIFLTTKDVYPNAVGSGVFSDYSLANPLFSSVAFHMLTAERKEKSEELFVHSALNRWGSDEPCLQKAAKLLLSTVYSEDAPRGDVGSIPATRPATELSHTAVGDSLVLHYDNKLLCEAVESLLASEGDYTDGYTFDVCDLTRQMLSNYARRLYIGVMEGYHNRDGRLFEAATNAFLRTLSDMNRLLRTREEFCLKSHCAKAQSRALNATDTSNYEIAFLASVSMFGPFREPEHFEFLWKEWSDLTGTYYAERWHEFFSMLAEGFKKRKDISTTCHKQINGRNPHAGNKFYKNLDKKERRWITGCTLQDCSEEDTLEVAAELLSKYKPMIERDYIQ